VLELLELELLELELELLLELDELLFKLDELLFKLLEELELELLELEEDAYLPSTLSMISVMPASTSKVRLASRISSIVYDLTASL
jgi:hypothetical protein